MQVTELYALTNWVNDHVKQIPHLYTDVFNVLRANTEGGQQQPFEDEKEALLAALKEVPLTALSVSQLDFLKMLGVGDHVGSEAASSLEEVFSGRVMDVATAAKKIEEQINSINEGIQKSDQIHEGLAGYALPDESAEEEALIRVTFSDGVEISNVAALKSWSKTWYDISRGITAAHGKAPEDMRVIGAGKGSLILDLATNLEIVETVMMIILLAGAAANQITQAMKNVAELRELKIKTDLKMLESDLLRHKEKQIDQITSQILKERGIELDDEEATKMLKKSVKDLVNFLVKGGDIDFVVPDKNAESEEEQNQSQMAKIKKLRESSREVRRLKHTLKMLEHHQEIVDDGEDSVDENNIDDSENP